MIFGIDIGGQSIKVGAFKDRKLVDKWTIPLDFKTKEEMVEAIYKSLESYDKNIEGIGIGCPGFITNNYIRLSANIHFLDDSNIVELFKKYTSAKVRILNDANAAALGEALYLGHKNLMFITLGTGVGGGLVVEGNVLEGVNGAGMEIGHYHSDDKYNFTCGCGSKGCVETLSSTKGIYNLVNFYRPTLNTKLPLQYEVKDVFDLAKVGDVLCEKVVSVFTDNLGKVLANAAVLTDPGVILLGGGISNAGEYLLNLVQQAFQKYANGAVAGTKIILAKLKGDAGIYGAYYSVA